MRNKRFTHFRLKNGIETIVYPISEVRSVSINLGLAAGSSIEKKGDVGTLHFLEHMMFRGSKKYPSPIEVALKEEELGITANAWVGQLDTRFWFLSPNDNLGETLDYITETMSQPLLTSRSVENSIKVILTEQRNFWDRPENQFYYRAMRKMLGEGHPYIRRGFGERDVVQKMTKEKVISFYNKFYVPSNFKLSVAGSVRSSVIKKLLENTLGSWKKSGRKVEHIRPKKPQIKSNYFKYHQPRKQVNFALSFPLSGFKEYSIEKRLSIGVFSFLLGGGLTSILYQRLREELGLAYGIWSRRSHWPYFGIFEIGGNVDAENLDEVISEIFSILDKVKKEGFKRVNFDRAISYINTQSLVRFSEVNRIASYFLRHMVDELGILLPEDYIKKAEKLEINQVNKLGDEVLNYKKMNFSLMGDKNLIAKTAIRKNFESLISSS